MPPSLPFSHPRVHFINDGVGQKNFAYEGMFCFGYTVLEEEGAELIFAERGGKRRSIRPMDMFGGSFLGGKSVVGFDMLGRGGGHKCQSVRGGFRVFCRL